MIVEVAADAAAGLTVRLAVVVWTPFVEFVATTVCGPAAVAEQEAPVQEPSGLITKVVAPVTSPRSWPNASKPRTV